MALGPGRFYGKSLPRPRFYADVKMNDERVDPPVPVMDPLLSWANEAHWSMGGKSLKRHRLQGRIEGSIKKLRDRQERAQRRTIISSSPLIAKSGVSGKKPLSLGSLESGSADRGEEAGQKGSQARMFPSPNGSVDRKRAKVRRVKKEFDRNGAEHSKGEAGGVASRTRRRGQAAENLDVGEEDAIPAATDGKGNTEKKKRKAVDGGSPRRTSPRKKRTI
ncbi:hypothetical protein MUK42_18244 [Musa troglodytarum]|uniref:Uncharacterized protein n=1 Tax=Musa troglodytarum TaxID=320322 RepID=A0A9E7HU57_9LILI|nr:hypothetical protein MUK42_18244 [Musa troglodytarum]